MRIRALLCLTLAGCLLLSGCGEDIGAEHAKCELASAGKTREPGTLGDPFGSSLELCMRAKGYEYKQDESNLCTVHLGGLYMSHCYRLWHSWRAWVS
jgi:predicted small secreted protein